MVSNCVLLNKHGWKMWSQNRTCSCRRGCRGFLLGKRCSGASDIKKNYIINVLTSGDKVVEAEELSPQLREMKKKKLEENGDSDRGYP